MLGGLVLNSKVVVLRHLMLVQILGPLLTCLQSVEVSLRGDAKRPQHATPRRHQPDTISAHGLLKSQVLPER
ncbi:hypothetical protein BJX99DRAFT_218626 [Aspergillus californicus]